METNMIKRFLLLFLAALCIIFSVACGDDGDGSDSNAAAPKPQVPTVEVIPEEIPRGEDTTVVIVAPTGYALTAVSTTGTCPYSGNIAGNPASFIMLGTLMGTIGSCTINLVYTKDGYNFPATVTVKIKTD
jgi:hypothetical protein